MEGVIDLWAPERLLILRAAVEGVNGDDVPFTDLPRLGGPQRLRGYPLDRFRGKTALLGTIEYRYPVHEWVAGALYVDAGQVTGNRRAERWWRTHLPEQVQERPVAEMLLAKESAPDEARELRPLRPAIR